MLIGEGEGEGEGAVIAGEMRGAQISSHVFTFPLVYGRQTKQTYGDSHHV